MSHRAPVALLALAGILSIAAPAAETPLGPVANLTFRDNAWNEGGFRVERSTGGESGPWIAVASLPAATGNNRASAPGSGETVPPVSVGWSDTLVARGVRYWYRVFAHNAGGDSLPSNVATLLIPQAQPSPAAPGTLEASRVGELINVSARALVTTDDLTVQPGFVVNGGPVTVLIRAVGPGLAPYGVPNLLADPRFEVRPAGGGAPVASNDNQTPQAVAAAAQVGAFAATANDAGLVVTLAPGNYTVVVRGAGETSGVVLVETYQVPAAQPLP